MQGDLAGALGALRGHQQQAGDLAELALQRGGDQGLGGFRAGAGKLGDDLDGREIDLGQCRDRQRAIAEAAGQQDGDRQQPGGDGARDERRRDVHCRALRWLVPGAVGLVGAFGARRRPALPAATLLPSDRREAPSITTFSPPLQAVGDDRALLVLIADGDRPGAWR